MNSVWLVYSLFTVPGILNSVMVNSAYIKNKNLSLSLSLHGWETYFYELNFYTVNKLFIIYMG